MIEQWSVSAALIGHDAANAARRLPEAEFDQVIGFCRSALKTAMAFKQDDASDAAKPPPS